MWLDRRVDLQPTEILVKVFLPFTHKLEFVKEFKQAHRRDDDIAIANAGMRVRFKQAPEGKSVRGGPLFLHLAAAATCATSGTASGLLLLLAAVPILRRVRVSHTHVTSDVRTFTTCSVVGHVTQQHTTVQV